MDPVELRLSNDTANDPITGKPFSLRLLNACLERGAASFGRSARTSGAADIVDGWQTGFGVAAGYYKSVVTPTDVMVTLARDAKVTVRLAGHEMGQGIRTVIAQTASDAFGLPVDVFTIEIGDTNMAIQHITAGSWGTQSVMRAVDVAATASAETLGVIARDHPDRPLRGGNDLAFELRGGALHAADGSSVDLSTLHRFSGKDITVGAFSAAPGTTR